MSRRRYSAALFVTLLLLWAVAGEATARSSAAPDVPVSALPAEARITLLHIRDGGPFPFSRDGVVFGNREHLLPPQPRGYYHEYTVPTPGVKTRGARRIICGGPRTAPHLCYYTSDHYE